MIVAAVFLLGITAGVLMFAPARTAHFVEAVSAGVVHALVDVVVLGVLGLVLAALTWVVTSIRCRR
ncbi:hypothetical protein [Streptomyces sp. NBC_00212]|uniref:hypothetical protein n=1 Tax=Streptomyces sp. NBC_00212 TaxID=2975684 RepID=UPI00324B31CB